MKDTMTWRTLIDNAPVFPCRQDSLSEQLADLEFVANKLGFQDAADYIKGVNDFYIKVRKQYQ